MELFKTETGETSEWIRMKGTENRILVGSDKEGLGVGLADSGGTVRIGVMLTKEDRPFLTVGSSEVGVDSGNALIQLDGSGEPTLSLSNRKGDGHVIAGTGQNGAPGVAVVYGAEGSGPWARFGMSGTALESAPQLKLKADGRKASHTLGFTQAAKPVLEMTDSQGRVRVRIGIGEDDKPFIDLLDEKGNPTEWKSSGR
jgi:hypothetical protein